jgi:polyisoprenoid-binding protein YceI
MATAQAESTIPTGIWQSDPVHSTVGFAVRHAVGTFRGSFGTFEATLSDTSGESRLTGRVPVETVEVKEENLEAHLLSPEFFDKDQTPEITFESSRIARDGDELVVEGDLAVKGITKPVTARGKLTGPISGADGSDRLGVELETTVDRHDYGLDWNMDMPDGSKILGDEVTLSVQLELIKSEEA